MVYHACIPLPRAAPSSSRLPHPPSPVPPPQAPTKSILALFFFVVGLSPNAKVWPDDDGAVYSFVTYLGARAQGGPHVSGPRRGGPAGARGPKTMPTGGRTSGFKASNRGGNDLGAADGGCGRQACFDVASTRRGCASALGIVLPRLFFYLCWGKCGPLQHLPLSLLQIV